MKVYHSKFSEVSTLINAGIPVLLTGEKGSGKTTLALDVAEKLKLDFYSMSMTRQTTLSHLLGFISVNGVYITSQIRKAAENGGLILLDEIDASDPNVILCLNTIENGYISFPDKIVKLHSDFRIMATSNPQDNHKDYNGRSKLDASTLDRFDIIHLDRDEDLEKTLVDGHTYAQISLARTCLEEINSNTYISMRDSIRLQNRKELNLVNGFIDRLLSKDLIALEKYKEREAELPKHVALSDCITLSDVWGLTSSGYA